MDISWHGIKSCAVKAAEKHFAHPCVHQHCGDGHCIHPLHLKPTTLGICLLYAVLWVPLAAPASALVQHSIRWYWPGEGQRRSGALPVFSQPACMLIPLFGQRNLHSSYMGLNQSFLPPLKKE